MFACEWLGVVLQEGFDDGWPFQLGQLVDGANVSGQLLDIDQKFIQSEISCSSQGQFGTCAVVRQEIALHANT